MPKEWSTVSKLTVCAMGLMLAGAVHAQSSVTLFGVVDLGLLVTNKTANSAGQNAGKQLLMVDGASSYSQFGLTGTEDLGDNLRAKFKLESGISVANGGLDHCNGNMFGCEAWIALAGNFGEVKTGLQFSPFLYTVFALDPRDMSFFGSGGVNYVSNILGTGINVANSVTYTSPSLFGLQAMLMFAFGDIAGDFPAGRQYSASVKYERSGLLVDAAIYDGNSGGTSPEPTNLSVEGRTLGAAYKFGTVTIKASFANYNVAGSFNNNVYGGGLDYLVQPWLELNGGVWVTSDRDDTTNHSLLAALGATYSLSVRTRLYGQFAVVNNHGAMNTGLSISGALYGVRGTTIGGVVGVQHSF